MVIPRRVLFAFAVSCVPGCHTAPSAAGMAAPPALRPCTPVPGEPGLRGLAPVGPGTAWVSGSKGTIARTTDGGATWQLVGPPDAAACDFRDIEAFDANTAVAMVAGQPARVYRTTDGGSSWRVVLADPHPAAFFDGIAFAGDVGILFADPIDGAFRIWTTRDGGATWTPVPGGALPAPLPGEAAFAASGTCVAVAGEPGHEQFWVATGGGPRARLLHGAGGTWRAIDVPLRAGSASTGGFGLAVRGNCLVLVGGDYAAPGDTSGTGARSDDGGASWQPLGGGMGFRSAVSWAGDATLLAVGSHGATWLAEGGRRGEPVGEQGFHCVARGRDGTLWAAGSEGRVATWPAPDATLRLASLFGDHMVLPAAGEVVVRGSASPATEVCVRGSWGSVATATSGRDGSFRCTLATPPLRGGPHEFTVSCGGQQLTVHDVLAGDVWLASGQSNMEMPLGNKHWSGGVHANADAIAAATLPGLRVFTVRQQAAERPADAVDGQWIVCSPANAGEISAAAFFFARELLREGVSPIGLVVSSWGGTVAEAWTSEAGLAAFPEFGAQLREQREGGGSSRQAQIQAFWRAVDASPAGPPAAVAVPDRWSLGGLADFDGVATYARDVELPPAFRGKDCWLELGPLDDMDTVWCNGERVGGMAAEGAWATPRRYRIAGQATQGPKLSLRVRVVDTGGEGGFSGRAEDVRLLLADDASVVLPLAGDWQRCVGSTLAELPAWPRAGGPNRPAVLWNGMIAPLLPFPFAGAIWYQGEANRGRAEQYTRLFPAMIADWRGAFGRELPFYFVQIAPFGYEHDRGETAELREAQAAALALPRTGMVVTLDCGDAGDIHPIRKQPVGERLAALALSRHYGRAGPCEGPVLATATAVGADVHLTFTATDGGLQLANDGAGFELAGADGRFQRATARLDGDHVVLRADTVARPTAVRYAWAAVPDWSLRNGAGFPGAPFRAAIR